GVVECLPAFRLLIFLDEPAVLTDDEIVDAHSTHIVPQDLYGFTAHSLQRRWVTRADKVFFRFSEACRYVEAGLFVDGADEIEAKGEEPLIERAACRCFRAGNILAEEFEVLAEVEDVETLFIQPRPEEIFAKSCAAPQHLPELRFGAHQLEQNEVHDLRH